MISNWVVQCVFQKNKKTRQSMSVSWYFEALPCPSESLLLKDVVFLTVGGVAGRQG